MSLGRDDRMGGVWSRERYRWGGARYTTYGVGGVQILTACCWLQVRQMIGRYDSDRMRKNRRARGRMDMVEVSKKVDDRAWSKRGVNRQIDLETCISKTNIVQKRAIPLA
jgi:hypothetical protein